MTKHRGRWRTILLSLLALGTGVLGGVATAPPRAEAATKRLFVYVHDRGTPGHILGFRMAANGQLTPLDGSPFNAGSGGGCGGPCGTMTYSAPRKLLFAGAGDGLHVFHVAANGGLTEVAGSPFGGFSTLGVTTVQKNGSTFVYAADWADDQVRGYRVNANGSLTELTTSPYPSFDEPVGGAAVKDLVFFANEDNNTVSAFRAQGNGTLVSAPGSPYSVPASFIFNLQLDPQGKTLYVGDNNDTKVFAFKVKPQDASLTALKGSPFTTLADAGEGTVPGKTRMVVVGDDGPTEDLQVLRRLGNGGLEALGEVQDSGFAIDGGGALDPKGKLLVVASNNGQVRSFRLNAQTGALTVADTETGAGFSVNAITVIQR